MDVQRVILVAALALISYMLVLQWNEDYGQQPTAQAPAASVSVYGSAATSSDLPTAVNTEKSVSGDLPITETTPISTPKAQLITVKTDVLDVLIDAKGGDIIQVALPAYKASLGSPLPFILLEQTPGRTYVSQSGLVGKNGPDASPDGRPTYVVESNEFTLGDKDSFNVDLLLTNPNGVTITKRYIFSKGSYTIGHEYIVNNGSAELFQANLFAQIKRDQSSDPNSSTDMGMQSYLGPVFSTAENKYQKYSFDDVDEVNFNATTPDGWAGMIQHYFLSAWIPAPGAEYTYSTRKLNGNYIAGFVSPAFEVPAGSEKTVSASFYAGPKDVDQMEAAAPNLELTLDYGWLWWIASPLYVVLKWIHGIVGNWGLTIICITILVKALLFQLNAKAFKSMAKMRKFGPEMTRLKELHGGDRQKMSQAMMELYKKEKINPLGGCLPIVAQMPIFISLYWVLMESVELRHAEFLYLTDLSTKDPYFILPIIMGVSMFIQQSLNPTPPDPMQAKVMKMLPILFTFFFLWFPAGLTLYWVVNNILSIAQQYVINKQIEAEPVAS
ncbi:membrane protein insertase YidC [Neptunomonas qingdaonensis]|uniref:Membrane protein insertase YidC n=1 Tax=Neptunomonas qingdaonensis TaxID=1045558 RepID=A0A1I2LML8_9GAMM|nr:membrane protein insertase YidC [Neptunomonas qingdaonensis]SFF78667.1 YidC/Oxa1 family membrane protein insertase [Neptunomonas qingdaonensis]